MAHKGARAVFGGTLGDGVDVRAMRQKIPVVSESVRRLIHDHLTGLEVLVTGERGHLNIFGTITDGERDSAQSIAAKTGISPLLEKSFGVMSTGERQRVLMTRALLQEPRIMVLDEPCSGLDLAGREWVLQSMESIARLENPPSLLLTTHHVEEIAPVFTHALLLNSGKVRQAGRLEDVFTSRNLSQMFDLPLEIQKQNGRWSARAAG